MLEPLDHFDLWPVDQVKVLTLFRPEEGYGETPLVYLYNGTQGLTLRLVDTTLKMLARALADMVEDLEDPGRPELRSYRLGP